MFEGRVRLSDDARKLGNSVRVAVGDLFKAKELAIRMNHLLLRYEEKLDKEKMRLSIPQEVEIKRQLEEKLIRELEGIRTAPDQFSALDNANPADLEHIIAMVKGKLMI